MCVVYFCWQWMFFRYKNIFFLSAKGTYYKHTCTYGCSEEMNAQFYVHSTDGYFTTRDCTQIEINDIVHRVHSTRICKISFSRKCKDKLYWLAQTRNQFQLSRFGALSPLFPTATPVPPVPPQVKWLARQNSSINFLLLFNHPATLTPGPLVRWVQLLISVSSD